MSEASWFGLRGEKLSAAFWLVFGQAMSCADAVATVDEAPAVLVRVWARNGSTSWRNLKGLLLR